MTKISLLFLAGVMTASMASAQQVYKWKDDKGKVQYGDFPTSDKVSKVDTKSPMQGTVSPTAGERQRVNSYSSESVSGGSGAGLGGKTASPARRSGCPYAR